MANGYWQKILRVNLTNLKSTVESIAEKDLKDFIGGAGLGAIMEAKNGVPTTKSMEQLNLT